MMCAAYAWFVSIGELIWLALKLGIDFTNDRTRSSFICWTTGNHKVFGLTRLGTVHCPRIEFLPWLSEFKPGRERVENETADWRPRTSLNCQLTVDEISLQLWKGSAHNRLSTLFPKKIVLDGCWLKIKNSSSRISLRSFWVDFNMKRGKNGKYGGCR